MQKVVGSSPIIRSHESPVNAGFRRLRGQRLGPRGNRMATLVSTVASLPSLCACAAVAWCLRPRRPPSVGLPRRERRDSHPRPPAWQAGNGANGDNRLRPGITGSSRHFVPRRTGS